MWTRAFPPPFSTLPAWGPQSMPLAPKGYDSFQNHPIPQRQGNSRPAGTRKLPFMNVKDHPICASCEITRWHHTCVIMPLYLTAEVKVELAYNQVAKFLPCLFSGTVDGLWHACKNPILLYFYQSASGIFSDCFFASGVWWYRIWSFLALSRPLKWALSLSLCSLVQVLVQVLAALPLLGWMLARKFIKHCNEHYFFLPGW